MADSSDVATLEKPDDAGTGSQGVVKRWMLELKQAAKDEQDWRKQVERIEKRYRGDDRIRIDSQNNRNEFNILWSNTETLSPALYNSTPTPDVRRRFRDKDPIGKAAAELLERSLDYSIDAYDFDDLMQDCIHDMLITGRAVARVRYMPSIKTLPMAGVDGQEQEGSYESLEYEQVICDLVPWQDFRRGPGKRWRDVTWVAFRSRLDRVELKEKFGNLGAQIELEDCDTGDDKSMDDQERDVFKRAPVWEIWDKEERKIIFIADSYKDAPLKVEDDPLGLDGFFPIARPMYSVRSTKSLIPVPEYTLYEDQAKELDRISGRINKLVNVMKMRGIYDSTLSDMKRIFDEGENVLIPAENVTALLERGGLEKAIWFMPIEMVSKVLLGLYQARQECKQVIYEITGISDILRGSSNPNETATAQGIKNQWGALRLQRRQAEVQRFARDLLRLKAEIIAEKFQPETVMDMANLKFPTQQEKQQAKMQQMMQQQMAMQNASQQLPPASQPGMPPAPQPPQPPQPEAPPPDSQEMLSKPSMEEVFGFLRDNAHRQFRIDIETDSTIGAIIQQDQKNITELLTGMTAFMQGVAPAVQAGALPMGAAKAIMLAAVRRFKMGSEVEDELDKIPEVLPKPPGNGEAEAEKMKAQIDAEKAQMQAEKSGMQAQMQVKEGELKIKELGMKVQEKAMALDAKEQQIGLREQELGLQEKGLSFQGEMLGNREGHLTDRTTALDAKEVTLDQVQMMVTQGQQEMVAAMEAKMNEFTAKVAGESQQMMTALLGQIAGSMTAPKRIIRDSQGRAAGVETVQ